MEKFSAKQTMRKLPFSALLLSSVLALTSLSVQASPDTDRVSQKIRFGGSIKLVLRDSVLIIT
jgi:hypothetical protein